MGKHHWPAIEVLYALGVLLVILGHSHSSDWSTFEHTPLVPLIRFIYLFHMAMFFCIAGFLFRNSDSLATKGYPRWLGNKALRLLVPYFLWSLIALAPKYYFEHHSFQGLTPATILTSLFCPRQNIWGHFWFLPVLFLTYALFGLLPKRQPAQQTPPALSGALLAVCLALYFLPVHSGILGLFDLCKSLVFFELGIIVREHLTTRWTVFEENVHRLAIPSAVVCFALGVWLGGFAPSNRAASLAAAVLLIAFCSLIATMMPPFSLISWIARNNFTLYLFSWMFQAVVMELCGRLHCPWHATSLAMFVAGFAGPAVLVLIFERLPWRDNRLLRLAVGFPS